MLIYCLLQLTYLQALLRLATIAYRWCIDRSESLFVLDNEIITELKTKVHSIVDVVLEKDHSAYLDVDSKAAYVKDSVDLFINLCKDVICVLLNRLIAFLLTHRICNA